MSPDDVKRARVLLRSCFCADPYDKADLGAANLALLRTTTVEWECVEDAAIYRDLCTFYDEFGHVPNISALKLRHKDDDDRVDRIDRLAMLKAEYRGAFHTVLDDVLRTQNQSSAFQAAKDFATIVHVGMDVGKGRDIRRLFGLADAQQYFDERMAEIRRSSGGAWERNPQPIFDVGDDVRLPEFPIDAIMSSEVRSLVAATATALGVDPGLPGMLALGVLAVACARGFDLEIRSDWRCPLGIYATYVGASSSKKGPAHGAICAPVKSWDERKHAEHDVAMAAWRRTKPKGKDPAMLADWEESRPVLAECLTTDVTIEEFVRSATPQGGAMAVIAGEASQLFSIMGGKYSSHGPALQNWCEGFSGGMIKVSRITRDRNYLPHPAFSILVGSQADVVRSLSCVDGVHAQGLFARFLWWYLPARKRVPVYPTPAVDEALREHWRVVIHRILDAQVEGTRRRVIRMSADAQAKVWELVNLIEPERLSGRDLERVGAWAGKAAEAIARIAAHFAICEAAEQNRLPGARMARPLVGILDDEVPEPELPEPEELEVQARHVAHARLLWEPLLAHALHAHVEAGGSPIPARAQMVIDRLRHKGLRTTSAKEVWDICRGAAGIKTMADLTPALQHLADRSWVRLTKATGPTGGRPSVLIDVHPTVHTPLAPVVPLRPEPLPDLLTAMREMQRKKQEKHT